MSIFFLLDYHQEHPHLRASEANAYREEADSCSNINMWNSILKYDSSDITNPTVIDLKADDELGFDPFEETNKALAEDILLEQEQQQQQQQLLKRHQLLRQQQQAAAAAAAAAAAVAQQQQQQQQQQQKLQLKTMLNTYHQMVAEQQQQQTRLPPPGFNGLTSGFSMTGKGAAPAAFLGGAASTASTSPQILLSGANKMTPIPPPGLGMAAAMAPPLSMNHHVAPPGLNSLNKHQPVDAAAFVLKDLENGLNNSLRNVFPISSVSTMNTVNTLNTLAATANNPQQISSPQNNQIANFFNLAQQQQQQRLQQQQQFHPQNLLHQLTSNMVSNSAKGQFLFFFLARYFSFCMRRAYALCVACKATNDGGIGEAWLKWGKIRCLFK